LQFITQFLALLVGMAAVCQAAAPPASRSGGDDARTAEHRIQWVSGPVAEPEPTADPPATLLDLETALEWTLRYNPALIVQRHNVGVSVEALEVARRFPTSLNPTVSLEVEPWTFGRRPNGEIEHLNTVIFASVQQPIELGHRQQHRTAMAQAALDQARSGSLAAELSALVETYRLHQGAAYRRQKLAVAQRLADFDVELVRTLRRQAEANQVGAAEVILAEVESQAAAQQLETARQEYAVALADLRRQFATPQAAGPIEPAGPLRVAADGLMSDEAQLVQLALASRPEIATARAQVASSQAALCLARADRIPVPSLGPAYELNESGESFYGVAVTTPLPLLNTGAALVRQREAEHHRDCVALEQARQQVATQVAAALAKWTQVRDAAVRAEARLGPIAAQAGQMQRLFEAGQADLVKWLQVRQRLIEGQGAALDTQWQSVQAYADLLTALGSAPLLATLPKAP
jgi:cobalt-zinc-cadmium efflux system outer membrane protein